MADRTDLPRIKPRQRPSIFNREMAEGALWGSLLSDLAVIPVALFSKRFGKLLHEPEALSLVAAMIGGTVGGIHGKDRMAREEKEGKVVRDPTFLNNGTNVGMAVGWMAYEVGMLATKEGRNFKWAAMLTTILAPAAIGSVIGKHHMQTELDEAVALKNRQTLLATGQFPQQASSLIDPKTASVESPVLAQESNKASR